MEYSIKKESQNTGSDTAKAAGSYTESRKHLLYYKVLRSLLTVICRADDTICDVGSNGVDMLSFLPCREKMSIDLRVPFSDDKVIGVKADFLKYEFEKGGVDIITCFQVLEHINNDQVEVFAKKLLKNSHIAVVSVPYMWPKGFCKWHVQDPVDVEKIISWFGVSPVFLYKVTEPTNHLSRLIAVFVKDAEGEIDRDYWRMDANAMLSKSGGTTAKNY